LFAQLIAASVAKSDGSSNIFSIDDDTGGQAGFMFGLANG